VDLADVEVEMMEGKRANFNTIDIEPLMDPEKYPLVGASIGPLNERTDVASPVGTLGGYIVADGTVYALTNHHVVFGDDRLEPFPSPTEISNSIIIHQPPKRELDRGIDTEEYIISYLESPQSKKHRATYELELKIHQNRLAMSRKWYDMPLTLGTVTGSSGKSIIPALGRSADWAIIKVGNDDRGTADTTKFVNEASNSFQF